LEPRSDITQCMSIYSYQLTNIAVE
jgi:hypothetical protein